MTTELTVPHENDFGIQPQFQAVAVNATEMKAANEGIKTFLRNKLAAVQCEIDEAQAALDSATKHKWKTSTFKNIMLRRKQEHLYYSKLLAACEAGFTIIPNMEVDVFAIRVKRDKPAHKVVQNIRTSSYSDPWINDESEQRLPVGEGRYESPTQTVEVDKSEGVNAKGEKTFVTTWIPDGFAQLDFPLSVAHPVVMDATARAMAMKIFDRIAVVPKTRSAGRGDPIVVGQITRKHGYTTKTASFLIAWYLDPRTL